VSIVTNLHQSIQTLPRDLDSSRLRIEVKPPPNLELCTPKPSSSHGHVHPRRIRSLPEQLPPPFQPSHGLNILAFEPDLLGCLGSFLDIGWVVGGEDPFDGSIGLGEEADLNEEGVG